MRLPVTRSPVLVVRSTSGNRNHRAIVGEALEDRRFGFEEGAAQPLGAALPADVAEVGTGGAALALAAKQLCVSARGSGSALTRRARAAVRRRAPVARPPTSRSRVRADAGAPRAIRRRGALESRDPQRRPR